MGFVFYDLETTGISPAFDQPLQFAAIRTDDSFVEIERVNLRCRIAPHIIPSPHALIVTGVTPAQLVDPELPSLFEFTQTIMEMTERWAPATWVGFNSIRFDEEVLRQAFFQNLQPNIYATQLNGNNRLDILTAVFAVWCRNPGLMHWPTDDTGRTTFKLDRLAPANGFNAHNAHDALGDVEATIHIARIIANGDPALWSAILHNRDKQNVMATLETFRPVELVLRFGGGPPRAYVGCFCGTAAGNPTNAAFFDLEAGDPEILIQADDAALFQAVDGTPQIIRSIAANKVPSLFPIANPNPDHLRKATLIAANPAFRARVGQAMAARYVEDPAASPPPVEKQIYSGFYSKADRDLLAEFQRADWSRRRDIVGLLTDVRLRQLGRRLIAFHAPEFMSVDEAEQYKAFLRERWNAPDAPGTEWTTIASAMRAIAELRAKPGGDREILDNMAAFIGVLMRGAHHARL
ncbi:exonuclease domain-containing protein [Rhodobacter capsulatus]|uniref:Exodeoxyribonuclease I subunit C n=1 Tax=Rhodobacter capsulatus TaxID=1061 RepID=A0A1G7T6N3_RHOCA|nr:exodeoxyribonuclease I [Rhodobacter capsulatus]WER10379.1 exonuclease domain-containing protein [Rhodobacter capsulatus]SDG30891.1 Exodeoxyribonuclease I subunit C [Rhodobacter capsulatus]